MITNHTSGNLILRQPGTSSEPATPDEPLYKAVGGEMAAENGYSNVFSYQIGYDHVGTTDGWSYYTTGGLGYVFEIGNTNSHPLTPRWSSTTTGAPCRAAATARRTTSPWRARRTRRTTPSLQAARPRDDPAAHEGLHEQDVGRAADQRALRHDHGGARAGNFEWHVNQSSRPLGPGERWTLTGERPEGVVQATQEISIARGQTQQLDLSACGGLPAGSDARPRPSIRAQARGRLQGPPVPRACDWQAEEASQTSSAATVRWRWRSWRGHDRWGSEGRVLTSAARLSGASGSRAASCQGRCAAGARASR